MIHIAIGSFSFFVIHLCDFVSLKRLSFAKPLVWIMGGGLLVYSLVELCLTPYKLLLPVWSAWLGWGLFSVSCLLLAYSLFINLPFRKTYIYKGVGDRLVTTGLYALVRHPGVHWFTLLVFSLILISRSVLLLIAAPIFIALDVLLVVVQDRLFFVRMFDGYGKYQRETPMLLPNKRSVNAFIKSWLQASAR